MTESGFAPAVALLALALAFLFAVTFRPRLALVVLVAAPIPFLRPNVWGANGALIAAAVVAVIGLACLSGDRFALHLGTGDYRGMLAVPVGLGLSYLVVLFRQLGTVAICD